MPWPAELLQPSPPSYVSSHFPVCVLANDQWRTDQRLAPHTQTPALFPDRRHNLCEILLNAHSPGATSPGAPPITSATLNTGFAPKCAGLAASNCSLR